MQETQSIQVQLRDASGLPDTLAVSFDMFEAIRQAARSCVDRIPDLFAAFMTTADAAVDGREAITAAPSLPAGPAAAQPGPWFQAEASTPRLDSSLPSGHSWTPASRRQRQPRRSPPIVSPAAMLRGGAADTPADDPW